MLCPPPSLSAGSLLPRPPPAIAAGLLATCLGPADRRWSRAAACAFALAVCFHLVLQSTLTLSSTPGRAHDQLYRDMGLVSSQLHVLNLSYSVIFLNLSCSVSLDKYQVPPNAHLIKFAETWIKLLDQLCFFSSQRQMRHQTLFQFLAIPSIWPCAFSIQLI